jgi:surface protein
LLPTSTREQLDAAINAWISNPTTAAATYGDINSWDVSAITDMSNLFAGKAAFNSNINSWNVSNVTNMSGMFFIAMTFDQPLNSWNVSNVTNMSIMFNTAYAFNQNIRMWSVGQTTILGDMFSVADAMQANQLAPPTPLYTYFNQGSAPLPTSTRELRGSNRYIRGYQHMECLRDNRYVLFIHI